MKAPLLALGLVLAATSVARADYPERPITWIVPFAAGGITDISSRKLAEVLAEDLGQPVIVTNKPGAGGLVGTKEAQGAAPDGYTVLYGSSGPFGIIPALQPEKLSYDPLKDFDFIRGVTASPQMIVTHANAPFNSIAELVAWGKENPGKLNFGSPGNGTAQHLAGELFQAAAGIEMMHIPYKAGPSQMVDLAAGVLDLSFEYSSVVKPYVEEGKMKIIGQTGRERIATFADVPTVVEAGYPEATNMGWTFLGAPAGLPQEVRARLETAMSVVMADPRIVEMAQSAGQIILPQVGAEGTAFIEAEIAKFRAAGGAIGN